MASASQQNSPQLPTKRHARVTAGMSNLSASAIRSLIRPWEGLLA